MWFHKKNLFNMFKTLILINFWFIEGLVCHSPETPSHQSWLKREETKVALSYGKILTTSEQGARTRRFYNSGLNQREL